MISVIIPIFNVKKYLEKCITSVIAQSYKDIEIILVDDGSTDGCDNLCDEYALKDNRIKVIHKSNGGLSDARNAGIDIAKGEYISFIDSDDYIESNYLEYLYNLISTNNSDISVCQYFYVDECSNFISKGGTKTDNVIYGNSNCMEAFLFDTSIDTPAWRKLYKSSLFSTGIRYPVGKYHEDVFTTYRLIACCKSIAIGSECLYAYRVRENSITNLTFSPKHLDAIEGNIERYKFISIKYPNLEIQASKGVVHAANACVFKIAKSHSDISPYKDFFKSIYKQYNHKYIRTNSRLMPKLFALLSSINVKLLANIISLFSK